MVYKDYTISESNNRGGKTGKGLNKTKTLRVTQCLGSGYIILKQFRYKLSDYDSKMKALNKCKLFVDSLMDGSKG